MMFVDQSEFDAVLSRLRVAIQPLVIKHRSHGDKLTWRLIHLIEQEAIHTLMSDTSLNHMYINMVRAAAPFNFPKTDDPVDFGGSSAIPCAYALIQKSYLSFH